MDNELEGVALEAARGRVEASDEGFAAVQTLWHAALARATSAEQERDRLRALIPPTPGGPRGCSLKWGHQADCIAGGPCDEEGVTLVRVRSGEQPGCICRPKHRVDDPICQYRPAPVVPDSPDVRERVWQAWHGTDEPWAGCADRERVERVLAVVGQGVTAEQDRDGLLPIEREVADFLWQKWRDPDNPAVLIHEDPRTVARHLRPYLRAAVRPTGQEQWSG